MQQGVSPRAQAHLTSMLWAHACWCTHQMPATRLCRSLDTTRCGWWCFKQAGTCAVCCCYDESVAETVGHALWVLEKPHARRACARNASAGACVRTHHLCATWSLCCVVQGVLIWHSSKTTELLKALLLRQPADAEGPPPQQHSALSAGRRCVAQLAGRPCSWRRLRLTGRMPSALIATEVVCKGVCMCLCCLLHDQRNIRPSVCSTCGMLMQTRDCPVLCA
jgi:hypothetical protein